MPPKPTSAAPQPQISDAVKMAAAASRADDTVYSKDTLHPPKKPIVTATAAAVDSIKFSSQQSTTSPKKKSSGTGGGSPMSTSAAQQLQQLKIERAQIAKRELKEMDAIERAFREDTNVWAGPKNVLFPKRYHEVPLEDEKGEEKCGDADAVKKSSINNPYMTFYGSQSRGWMYGEGSAGIGGRSWMEITDSSNNNTTPPTLDATNNKSNNAAFLMDDVTLIDNALRVNGLTRNDVTPKAYACFLEQARRYALELLADAQDYAIHAQRNTIPSLLPADLLLAAEMREDGNGGGGGGIGGVPSTLPTPEQISDLSSEVNRVPLPPIPTNCYNGVALPPVEQQLTSRTYDVVNGARKAQRMMRGGDLPLTSADVGSGAAKKGGEGSGGPSSHSKNKSFGAYGAGKGRQIAVHIKSKTSDSSGGNSSAPAAASDVGGTASTNTKPKGQKRTLTEL